MGSRREEEDRNSEIDNGLSLTLSSTPSLSLSLSLSPCTYEDGEFGDEVVVEVKEG
jgi:hypothetical protein